MIAAVTIVFLQSVSPSWPHAFSIFVLDSFLPIVIDHVSSSIPTTRYLGILLGLCKILCQLVQLNI